MHVCLRLLLVALLVALPALPLHADHGFVPGETKPAGDGPAVQVPGGWMVAYDETIPGTSVTFRMIPLPGGTFRMGSPDGESDRSSDEGPQVEVAVEPCWIGKCEVSWAEYKRYMAAFEIFKAMRSAGIRPVTAANGADAVTAPSALYDPTTTFVNGEDDTLPAVTMTQFAARQYTKWLSGLTGRFYRLPAESEWEYACRAGTTTLWNVGDDVEDLDDSAWFADNSDEAPHPVGGKAANAWGLHDMHGNVAEWCVDELVAGGYGRQAALPQVDPNLPKSPWWYTEEPALGVGMRVVRPLAEPDVAVRRRWWDADTEGIKADTADRVQQGRGALGIVDPNLPADLKAEGITE